ncbi:NCA2-domain-containing protein [Dendrothele bispora CBS 962.96]|uniref:NCA2-domain-containing protein n=1 Tax=Dendrothele bispora (strain CBS 962.96) TaxID=1314807 RepID=A0A4S8MNR1_DENBC|nr:NCA2-domain-containing protein [Dendrothele bispora CBS 962.96]
MSLLNKLVVALYAESLDTLLQQSVSAEKEAQWWDRIGRSPFNVLFYLLQTFPSRILNVSCTIYNELRAHDLPLRPSQFTPRSLSNLFPSRGFLQPSALVTSVFPHLHHSPQLLSISSPFFYTRSFPLHSQGSVKGTIQLSLGAVINCLRSTCHILVLPYHFTRQECLYKKKELETIRDERARSLGELAQLRQFLQLGLEREGGDASLESFMSELNRVISDNQYASSASPSSQSVIQGLSLFSSTTLQSCAVRYSERLEKQQLLRPSRITRSWPQALFGPPLLYYACTSLYESRKSLYEFGQETKSVVKGFLVDWLIEPLKGVVDTVRSKEDNGVIVSQEGVTADYQSLERMSLALAKEQLHYGPEQLEQLSQRIKVGDLTPILKLYEDDIRSPLKSAVTGTLLRTVFIQVQKAKVKYNLSNVRLGVHVLKMSFFLKVDIDQALAGIDRLLKSQELTFAFVGVAPALAIVYSLGSYLRGLFRGGRGRGRYGNKHRRATIFFVMRRIERLLVSDHPELVEGRLELTPLTTGLLLLSVAQLRTYAETYLPAGSKLREGFLEDVDDLQNPEFGVNDKLRVVERMWRSWSNVLGWGNGIV